MDEAAGHGHDAAMVVCGVDDSGAARIAARTAREFAARLSEPLVLMHVAPTPVVPGASAVPRGHDELRDLVLADAYRLLRKTAAEAECAEAELRVEVGEAATRLVAFADDHDATLVVVGTRGRGALRAALLGSVSLRVSREASCPVLMVPPRVRLGGDARLPSRAAER